MASIQISVKCAFISYLIIIETEVINICTYFEHILRCGPHAYNCTLGKSFPGPRLRHGDGLPPAAVVAVPPRAVVRPADERALALCVRVAVPLALAAEAGLQVSCLFTFCCLFTSTHSLT